MTDPNAPRLVFLTADPDRKVHAATRLHDPHKGWVISTHCKEVVQESAQHVMTLWGAAEATCEHCRSLLDRIKNL